MLWMYHVGLGVTCLLFFALRSVRVFCNGLSQLKSNVSLVRGVQITLICRSKDTYIECS